jgi:hypothetical protein
VVENPDIIEDFPGGMLILLPEVDLELAEMNLQIGVAALRDGENVTFHHLRASEIPPEEELPDAVFTPVPGFTGLF